MRIMKLNEERKQLYADLGFNSDLDGCVFFDDLVEEVRQLMDIDELDQNKIKEILPSLELEYYHFFYEVSRFVYLGEIDSFLKSRRKTSKSKTMFNKVFGARKTISKEKGVYDLAKYLNKKRDLQNGHVKVLVNKEV